MTAKLKLRGKKLEQAIRDGIKTLASQNDNYIYNASELSKFIGTSRVSLNKYRNIIDEVLYVLKAEKRTSTGSMLNEQLLMKIERLELENQNLKKSLASFRGHHVELYQRLYMNSYDMSQLIRPVLVQESIETKNCILCNSEIKQEAINKKTNSIL